MIILQVKQYAPDPSWKNLMCEDPEHSLQATFSTTVMGAMNTSDQLTNRTLTTMDDRSCICLSRRTAVCLLLLLEGAVCVGGVAVDAYHYNANGVVCVKCPPGTAVEKDCTTSFTNSTCQPCPDHYFMDDYNGGPECKLCKNSCPKNGQEVQTCTPTTNRVCQCDDGYHRYPVDHYDPHYKCRPHTPCKTGYGIDSYGNHSHDTTCEKCVLGLHFVDLSDPGHPRCEACSVCPSNRSVLSSCTLRNDTVCSENSTEINTTPQPQHGDDSSGLSGGAIAGIVIVCILLVVVGIVIGVIFYRRRQNTPTDQEIGLERREENGKVPDEAPLIPSWTEWFIERKVFPFLSNQLGGEWQSFILQLPGWPKTTSVMTVIEHKKEEEGLVANKIMGCLNKWKKEADEGAVCKDSIVNTLKAVDRTDLEGRLQELSKSSSDENGQ